MRALRLVLCAWLSMASSCLREGTIEPVRETVMVHGMAEAGSTSIGIAIASVSATSLASPVSGATVTLRRGETDVVLTQAGSASSFCFAPSEFGFEVEAECYAAVLGEPIASGETLGLDIELADGTRIVGSTTTPAPPVLEQPRPGSDMEIEFVWQPYDAGGFVLRDEPIVVRWSGSGGPADLMLDVEQLFDDGAAVNCGAGLSFGNVLHSRSPAYMSAPHHCEGDRTDPVWDSAYVDLIVVDYDDNARDYIAATEETGAGVVLDGASPGLVVAAGGVLVSGVFGSAARTIAPLTLRATLVIDHGSSAIDMHVHASKIGPMRTTVEIPDRYRARLLELAARRGEKGFSGLVREALAAYLAEVDRAEADTEAAISALGELDEAAASDLEAAIEELRARWR